VQEPCKLRTINNITNNINISVDKETIIIKDKDKDKDKDKEKDKDLNNKSHVDTNKSYLEANKSYADTNKSCTDDKNNSMTMNKEEKKITTKINMKISKYKKRKTDVPMDISSNNQSNILIFTLLTKLFS